MKPDPKFVAYEKREASPEYAKLLEESALLRSALREIVEHAKAALPLIPIGVNETEILWLGDAIRKAKAALRGGE